MTDNKSDVVETSTENNTLPLSALIAFKFGNSRQTMKQVELDELKASIKELGVLQPILVRPSEDNQGMFEVVAGFRRWTAAQALSLPIIPCNIRLLDDKQAYEAHLAENLDRSDLDIVSEAKAAQKFVSLYSGDHSEAATRLGWSEKKVNDRLQLLRCSENVLTALSEEKIGITHAVILSSFSEKLQDGTLTKIISEKWSVEHLKERAGKAKKFLHTAKFDTTACDSCANNTVHQNDLFATEINSKAQCAKLECWKGKTDHWLTVQRAKAEEKYGKVLLWVESGETDRNTVTKSVVGEEQFESGCSTCESRSVIMDDRYGKEGNLIESQCIDKICFTKCQKAHKNNIETPLTQDVSNKNTDTSLSDKAKTSKTKNKATIEQKTPKSVGLREESLLRKATFNHLPDDPKLFHSIVLSLLSELTGFKTDIIKQGTSFNDKVKSSYVNDIQEINEAIKASLIHYMDVKVDECTYDSKSPTKTLISVLSTLDNRKEIATAAWNADKETLSNYTISGISQLCKESGFIQAFDTDEANIKANVNFDKISSKAKGKFIEAVIAYKSFDWSGFAPLSMLKHVKA